MPEVTINVGGRDFVVGCQEGEEHFLHAAAKMLDTEAQTVLGQGTRLPEGRMLLMAGLLLADKTAEADDRLRVAEVRIAELEAQLAEALARPLPPPERVEVAVVPASVTETLAELTARAEALAASAEERLAKAR